MLESYSLYNQKALRELGTVPPRELGTVPLLAGHFRTTKIGVFEDFGVNTWSQLVCLGFRFFSQLGTFWVLVFSDIQQPLFFESLFMRQLVKMFFNKHYKIVFFRVFFSKRTKITDR